MLIESRPTKVWSLVRGVRVVSFKPGIDTSTVVFFRWPPRARVNNSNQDEKSDENMTHEDALKHLLGSGDGSGERFVGALKRFVDADSVSASNVAGERAAS